VLGGLGIGGFGVGGFGVLGVAKQAVEDGFVVNLVFCNIACAA
jgi:hypothetical protein